MDITVELTDFKKEGTGRFVFCGGKHCQSRSLF